MARPGRLLISLAALVTGLGALAADFNVTHIYNPTWPGHAKFHVGQTMAMAVLLCCASLWLLWVPAAASATTSTSITAANGAARERKEGRGDTDKVRTAVQRQRLDAAALLAAIYWVTQMAAYAFPGTTPFDVIPGRVDPDPLLQFKLEVAMLAFVGVGWWLER
ncbi:uncharacterized protein K452DRAFT_291971 [Aplosporella prunicola CBS 121167]|uniref:Uncharacterized protein n=1 Tax=Aplosporella prunicola CBS 121167 TaxID=1176127 RepID=A0A6A6B140_9PEZI|nr:uncharacterized protein K452DRAFT_291971 [Aplosporella prunicola CBS 121167]KAF2136934.1 hypothetical protein K452DRAFT_291971 [Aplosporella prunicola CBS 121167]